VVAAGGERAVTLWQTATGGELLRLEQPATAAVVAFSPDGAVLTAAGFDGAVRSWAVATGEPTDAALVPGPLGLAALNPRRRILATTDLHRPRGASDLLENPVRIWDLQPARVPR